MTKVVPDPELDAEAAAWADRLGHGPTATYAATKDLLDLWRSEGRDAAWARLYDISMLLFEREDVQTAIRAAAASMDAGLPLTPATWPNR
ncbi:hypothetical protein ACWEO4_47220 [Streptomyces sp. NPDC004393]|uniref:hypothetical protein n=1 Tax=Streptomyces sp. NPDC004533 TaxID=3154278 RepID=UPI0033B05E88